MSGILQNTSLYQGLAGLLGLTGVGLGAFGAHSLRGKIAPEKLASWQTAVQYQLLHSVVMFATTLYAQHHRHDSKLFRNTLRCWAAGTLMFSGSIYALVLGGPGFPFGPMTPIGGVTLMIGWALAIFSL